MAEGQPDPGRPVVLGLGSASSTSRTATGFAPILEKAAADRAAAPGSDDRKHRRLLRRAAWTRRRSRRRRRAARSPSSTPSTASRPRPTSRPRSRRLQRLGADAVFGFTSEQDRKTSTEVIAYAAQGGLGHARPRLLHEDRRRVESAARQVRRAPVAQCSGCSATSPAAAEADAKTVMAIETRLAEASMTNVERRDTDKTYNRRDPAGSAKLTPNFSWPAYFRAGRRRAGRGQRRAAGLLRGGEPRAPGDAAAAVEDVPALARHQLRGAATLEGVRRRATSPSTGRPSPERPENEPRWKRCVTATTNAVGMALGKAYVRDYFPPPAKARADEMVRNLVAALRDDLQTLPWMGEATRRGGRREALRVQPQDRLPARVARLCRTRRSTADRTCSNAQRADAFEFHRQLAKVGTPRRPRGLGDESSRRERLLRSAAERDRVSGGNPPAAVLRRVATTTPSTTARSARSSATR